MLAPCQPAGVALGTFLAELSGVLVVLLVTGVAGLGRAGVGAGGMALGTGQFAVTPCEGVACQTVIEIRPLPASRCVALGTFLAGLPRVDVILLMALVAGLRRALENTSLVALHTVQLGVFPHEQLLDLVVADRDGIPSHSCVTKRTLFVAERAVVWRRGPILLCWIVADHTIVSFGKGVRGGRSPRYGIHG